MKLALFDVSGIFRRFFHAMEHEEVNEAYRRTIGYVHAKANGFDGVGICCDHGPYIRKEMDPTYKEQREAAPVVMHEQLRATIEQLDADGFHVFDAKGYEADDLIATVCGWAKKAGHEVTVFSSDKDILSLVGDGVRVVSPATNQEYATAEEVKTRIGVPPHLVSDFFALVGDKADNIKGLDKCGKVTASKWLNEIGPLSDLLAHPEKLPQKFCEALMTKDVRDGVALSYRLAQLMTAPIDPSIILTKKERKQTEVVDMPNEMPEPTDREDLVEELKARIAAEDKGAPMVRGEFEIAPPKAAPAPQPQPTKAIAKVEPKPMAPQESAPPPAEWEKTLEPRGLKDAMWLAHQLYDSRLFGNFPNPQAIMSIIIAGRAHGLGVFQSLQGYHNIQGKPAASAQLLVGIVKRHPVCKFFRLVEATDKQATFETHREGEPGPTRMSYTMEQAVAAGLDKKDNWRKDKQAMLVARASSRLARFVYQDLVGGLYTPDELEDAA